MLKEHKVPSAVLGMDLFPDGKRAVVACLDGGVFEVELESGATTQIGQHESYASSVSLIAEGKIAVSGGYDGRLIWHDIPGRKSIRSVRAHSFWSWQSAASKDGKWVASVSGQYLCGGYKYEPAEAAEPIVKVFDAATGELHKAFTHVPSVQAVGFSPDGKFVAAGNLMGEIRVWEISSGEEKARWTTPSFTGWGIIKGHYYTGGIYALMFSVDGKEIYAAGMGTTTDPAAGNGKQIWQRFAWTETPARKISETKESENGAGLMETLAWSPSAGKFVMAGRLFQGKWNTAIFETATGSLSHSLDSKMRVTAAKWSGDGTRLILAGATGQEKKKDGKYPHWGRVKVYTLAEG